ncbi:hypothetical protein A2397_04595 [Candidatus Amesbacteria bacterium RIFOXYB1_FULL_44_23]|uniref:EfeO-type cupredoxin-like domain-containing protein n=1 Tax=Candidatus Amesbacteria bacterium RIFOXYB1_FULL_44_23 TaxID=1797263 RepID=A0A1F4ZVG4_9BACT|nr:MAG: hypothetical protein A2397_04595 [Candidatus Amesbacteria bacterium RIFOXYB1_FULL_44_23]
MEEKLTPANDNKPMPMLLPVSLAIVALLVVVGFFLTKKDSSQDVMVSETKSSSTMSSDIPSATTAPQMTDSQVKTFELEAGSFYFKPNVISVKKGDKVKVVINSVSMMHDFVIDELNVRMPVTKSGETNSVEFVADKAGTFEFYCSVGQHRQNGQVGTLVVTE